jgi:deoxyribose-phosphate aldolase
MGDLPSQTHAPGPGSATGDLSTALWLELAIRCLDLTSLEGSETTEEVGALCEKAIHPDPDDPTTPNVAAVVLYPAMVPVAAELLKGSPVRVASVNGFPTPEAPLEDRLEEIRIAVGAGASEIDAVLDRDRFLSGDREGAAREIARAKEAAGPALLKVILETGELGSSERIREASILAMNAGADFIKSSTGKVGSGVTPEAAATMMEAARDFHRDGGRAVGIKISGGIRTVEQATPYLDLLQATLGSDWLRPERFRIGASALLDDLVAHLRRDPGPR